mgnify:FL=1
MLNVWIKPLSDHQQTFDMTDFFRFYNYTPTMQSIL